MRTIGNHPHGSRTVQYLWYLFLSAAVVALLLVCARSEKRDEETEKAFPLTFRAETEDTDVTIRCWLNGNKCIVFVPSWVEMDGMTMVFKSETELYLDGKKLSDGMRCGEFVPGREYLLSGAVPEELRLTFLLSSVIPTLHMMTYDGAMEAVHADKSHTERAGLLLLMPDGSVRYRSEYTDKISGHGNSTWVLEKKSYNLSLHEEADLLGTGNKRERFTLISNAIDETCLRNRIVYEFAGSVAGYDGFAPACMNVDLYINGEYAGLYLLCEKPVPDHLTLDSILFEITGYDSASERQLLKWDRGTWAEIHIPKPCTSTKRKYLEERIYQLQKALVSDGGDSIEVGQSLCSMIDLDSWARKYLIEEVFENADAGFYSQYAYWDEALCRFYAGPCWDYDAAMGMFSKHFTNCFLARRSQLNEIRSNPMFSLLWQKEEFRNAVVEIYRDEFAPKLDNLINVTIPALRTELRAATERNCVRWFDDIPEEETETAIDNMTEYLRQHIAFLSSAWIEGVNYYTLTLDLYPGAIYLYYCIPEGENCLSLPTPVELTEEDSLGEVWYVGGGGEIFDRASVLTEDLMLRAYNPVTPSGNRERAEERVPS